MSGKVLTAVGVNQQWGFSPSLNLVQGRSRLCKEENILILGGCDVRHVLKTVHDTCTNPTLEGDHTINFYMMESTPQCIARHMLLFAILLDDARSLEDRISRFLEVYGNLMLREKTQTYMASVAKSLFEVLSGDDPLTDCLAPQYRHAASSYFDMSALKYKDRDRIEDAVRFAISRKVLDMGKLWDQRLRHYYAERYDSRANVLDWDYYMRLEYSPMVIVHFLHYKRWRLTGQAFEVRDSQYTEPNRTLASVREGYQKGKGPVTLKGYWGDTIVSPYAAFGIEAPDRTLFAMTNKQFHKNAIHVSEFNLKRYATMCLYSRHGIAPVPAQADVAQADKKEQDRSTPKQEHEAPEPAPDSATPQTSQEDKEEEEKKGDDPVEATQSECHNPRLRLRFRILPMLGDMKELLKAKYAHKFSVIYVGQMFIHAVTPQLAGLLQRDRLRSADPSLVIEGVRCVPFTVEQREAYETKMTQLAGEAGWKLMAVPAARTDSFDAVKENSPELAATLSAKAKQRPSAKAFLWYGGDCTGDDTTNAAAAPNTGSVTGDMPASVALQ